MPKILFSDLDGTLIDHEGKPTHPENFTYLSKVREQGGLVALCTGRNNIDLIPTLNKIAIPYDYLVLCNGAYLVDRNGEVIDRRDISYQLGYEVLEAFCPYEELVIYFCDEKRCVFRDSKGMHVLDAEGVLHDSDVSFERLVQQADRFTIIGVNQEDHGTEILNQAVQAILPAHTLSLSWFYNTTYVDIMAHGASKGNGMQRLCQYLGIDLEDCYAIGDSFNDISMLQAAGHGFTFSHAPEPLRNEAEAIVEGVYQVCQRML